MLRHPIRDAHKWMNEIPTVSIHYLAIVIMQFACFYFGAWLCWVDEYRWAKNRIKNTAVKVFTPVCMNGTNCLKKQIYRCMIQDGKRFNKLNRRATVMVTKKTPMLRSFNREQGSVVQSFHVRSYAINNFLTDNYTLPKFLWIWHDDSKNLSVLSF